MEKSKETNFKGKPLLTSNVNKKKCLIISNAKKMTEQEIPIANLQKEKKTRNVNSNLNMVPIRRNLKKKE